MVHILVLSSKFVRTCESAFCKVIFLQGKESLNGDSFYNSRRNLIFFNQFHLFRQSLEKRGTSTFTD